MLTVSFCPKNEFLIAPSCHRFRTRIKWSMKVFTPFQVRKAYSHLGKDPCPPSNDDREDQVHSLRNVEASHVAKTIITWITIIMTSTTPLTICRMQSISSPHSSSPASPMPLASSASVACTLSSTTTCLKRWRITLPTKVTLSRTIPLLSGTRRITLTTRQHQTVLMDSTTNSKIPTSGTLPHHRRITPCRKKAARGTIKEDHLADSLLQHPSITTLPSLEQECKGDKSQHKLPRTHQRSLLNLKLKALTAANTTDRGYSQRRRKPNRRPSWSSITRMGLALTSISFKWWREKWSTRALMWVSTTSLT